MDNIFNKINEKNQKEIEKINANIAKAEGEIERLGATLKFDADMEEYSKASIKINSYKEFIEKNKEQIKFIISNPYTEEVCYQRRDAIQKEYNVKFKKQYADIVSQIEKLCSSFDDYGQITDNFINDRNNLNSNAAKIGCTASVYDGEGIKNDYYLEYKDVIRDLKRIASLKRLQ